ncbi:MAG: hypothetical protein LBJ00_18670 [Planctomycetaceae bacterium]|jgi:hypothetical protein|nr:hypothetical protein [Planctomycetaceae bacterium]
MIILYPGYSLQTFASDLTEEEANEILSAYTALFHPAIFKHFNKIPQWESASNISLDSTAKLILVPPCCEPLLPKEFTKTDSENKIAVIRNLKSRNAIVNEIIKQFNITHNFNNDLVVNFYALGTAALFVNLLAHHLHYMDNVNDASLTQSFRDIIENASNNDNPESKTDKSTASNLFEDAFDRICETKECYYPVSSYLINLTLVVKSTLGEPFRRLLSSRDCVNLLIPSLLLDSLPEVDPASFELLKSAVESGKVDFAADDISDTSLLLFPILDAADKILRGVSIYRERLGITPTIYGRQWAGLTPFLPQILKLAGFKGVLYFAPLDGWLLKQRNYSKMIWKGVDGTKIDALTRYPRNCTTSKEFFDFAEHYSDLISGDSSPTAVFAEFPVDKTKKIQNENSAESNSNNLRNENSGTDNFCNDNSTDDVSDSVDWCNDMRLMSKYTTQLGEFVKLGSYFATTAQTGSVESISVENYITGEPSDIPFWIRIYRENLSRLIVSALGTTSQSLEQKPANKSILTSVGDSVLDFIAAVGSCGFGGQYFQACLPNNEKINSANSEISPEGDKKNQLGRCGIAILNAWNFGRRVFVDVSNWSALPAAVAPIVFAEEEAGKKEIVVDVPPLGYVVIPEPEVKTKITKTNNFAHQNEEKQDAKIASNVQNPNTQSQQNKTITQNRNQPPKPIKAEKRTAPKSKSQKGGWNIISDLFVKKSKPSLITESDEQNAFFLQNEFFVAKIDSGTGMLRSLFTGNYRYNRLSQQLGFRLPKALRDLDSRLANDPNRGYASSVVDEVSLEELGSVTGSFKICGRLICNDGCEAAKFTELVTIRRYSRILEFNYTIEPFIEPSGDSAWDSYYAIRSAWNDSSIELRGSLGDGIYHPTTNRIVSPRFVDLRTDKRAVTFFSEGLPFHRRFSERYLDTILITKDNNKYDADGNKIDENDNNTNSTNQTQNSNNSNSECGRVARNFRFGVGIDIRHPFASSLEFMLAKDDLTVPVCCGDGVFSRWFFRVDAANVAALHWEPVYGCGKDAEVDADNNTDNEIIGFKVFLLETEGTQTNSVLRSFRPIARSYTTNFLDEELQKLNINDAGVQITLRSHELLPVTCFFEQKHAKKILKLF